MQYSQTAPALGGPGDFFPAAEDIARHRILETANPGHCCFLRKEGWQAALNKALCQAAVNDLVRILRPAPRQAIARWQDQAVGKILPVLHDATPGPSPLQRDARWAL